ncbi:MAG TPA: hypothetical protein PK142_02740 [bacterium]|nr:hypothetical protein [bacterium]
MTQIIPILVLIFLFLLLFFLIVKWLYHGKAKKMSDLSIGERVVILQKFGDHDYHYYIIMIDRTGEIKLFKDKNSYDKDQSHLFLWNGKRLVPSY